MKMARQFRWLALLALILITLLALTNCAEIEQRTTPTPTRTPPVTITASPTATPEPMLLNYSLVGRNLEHWYPEIFVFVIGDDEYTVDRTGKALRVGDSGSRDFSLPLDFSPSATSGVIAQPIGYTVYQNNLLLFYKAEIYGNTGYGYLVLFDDETLSVLWQALIPAFNVGEPLFHNHFAIKNCHSKQKVKVFKYLVHFFLPSGKKCCF